MLLRTPLTSLFFNDTATTDIYTLSLHDALPIYAAWGWPRSSVCGAVGRSCAWCSWATGVRQQRDDFPRRPGRRRVPRSEEHTSELQSRRDLVCRLLLEKKKKEVVRTQGIGAEGQ